MRKAGTLIFAALFSAIARAQSGVSLPDLPSAPVAANLNLYALNAHDSIPQTQTQGNPPPDALGSPRLTRIDAEQMALKNNPRISVSKLQALAQHQVVREAHSAELPMLNGAVTAEKAQDASRISAGSLTASRLFTHAGAGGSLSQLITDFGRTHNLVLTQKLRERAANATALATQEEIVLATDQAFYDALTAQAVLQVAKQTVATRQATETQVNQMTQTRLKSTLDLSFADVNLSQSQLLQLDAQNNADATMASLDSVLGLDHEITYELVDDSAASNAPPGDYQQLIQTALAQRPDLQSLTFSQQSAQKFARAQWDQLLPSISALGVVGSVPVHVDQYYTANWWGAVGINMNIPILNGFLYPQKPGRRSIARAPMRSAPGICVTRSSATYVPPGSRPIPPIRELR